MSSTLKKPSSNGNISDENRALIPTCLILEFVLLFLMLRSKVGEGSKPKLTSLSLSFFFYKVKITTPHRVALGIKLDNICKAMHTQGQSIKVSCVLLPSSPNLHRR